MSGMPLKTAVSDVYPNPDNATANAGFGALWTALNEATEKPELDLASAGTIDLGGQLSTKLRITGTTGPITSFGTTYRGPILLRFAGAVPITHNATTLILPGGANLTTSAGGTMIVYPKATAGVADGWIVTYASDYLPNTALAPSRVKGLIGAPNAATPLTKYDLSADEVVLRNANGGTITRYLTGTITNDLGLAGSTANGRDQVAAFTASSNINLFFVWNGTTLATVASTAAHTTGPVLPTGYTHWCYATTVRWNVSSNLIATFAKGCMIYYNKGDGLETMVLNNGVATTLTAVSMASVVPTIALSVIVKFYLNATHSATGTFFSYIRPTGSSISGEMIFSVSNQVAGTAFSTVARTEMAPGVGPSLDYMISGVPTTGGVQITVLAYRVPNGDS